MNKKQIAIDRAAAVNLKIELDDGDSIKALLSRDSGLFCITEKKIVRIRSPDSTDPDRSYADVPWQQQVFIPHGSRDPIVARTILQTKSLAEIFFGHSERYNELLEVSWGVLNSLVSLRMIRSRLENQITQIADEIQTNYAEYALDKEPKPLPIVEYYDIEFRSFVNEVRRALNTVSSLFFVLTKQEFAPGHFHKALAWAVKEYGKDSLLAQLLAGDQSWIKTWIDIRTAIEHPKPDRFIETLNFTLEADRQIRLPTWRFVHPEYDMGSPQNLLEVFQYCIDNILKFFEDLQIALSDGQLPSFVKVECIEIAKIDRDQSAPMRFSFRTFIDQRTAR